MDTFEDFFLELENEEYLNTEEPQPWSCKFKFEWDTVEQRSICWKCGRVIIRPIYSNGGDFDALNSGRQYHGKVGRFSQPQCPSKYFEATSAQNHANCVKTYASGT